LQATEIVGLQKKLAHLPVTGLIRL
jgi:hypothetical protein